MSEMSKKARSDMRAKAIRMTGGDPHKKVDSSSWLPTEPLNTTAKTGARPIRPRIYKAGGAVQGDRGPRRADKAPRGAATEIANAKINRNVPAANAEEFGKPHVGAFKKGGRTHRDMGGGMTDPRATAQAAMAAANQRSGTTPSRMDFNNARSGVSKLIGLKKGGAAEKSGAYFGGTRPTGGRIPRKAGGRAKGKTNINIVIAQPKAEQAQAPNNAPIRPPIPPPQVPPPMPPPMMPPGGVGGPPIPPPSMAGGNGMPMPMPRATGGRTYRTTKDMDAGSLGGKGRLEKIDIQRHSERKSGGRLTAGAGSGLGRLEKIELQKGSQ